LKEFAGKSGESGKLGVCILASPFYEQKKYLLCLQQSRTGGRLTDNQLIKIVFFSVDQNFHNQLTEILDAFQLIESFNNEFDQTPKI
jgi:hypothetical protein